MSVARQFVKASLVAAWATVGIAWLATAPRADGPEELTLPAANAAQPSQAKWVGVGGCAAAACHGGEVEKPRGEYTTWISRDSHSRAYSVLFNETSLQMARQLAGGDASRALPPHEDRRCLACHAPTGPDSERSPQLVGDGVGCEACHGAADKWASAHSTIDWKSLAPAEKATKRKQLGMTDTRDVLVRTQQCVRCHVGEGEADVTHDLIAAGHPRLSFEMGTFHDQMPKHWSHEAERSADRAFEAKLWVVGQLTAAAAHFELIAARAERGNRIEFANYDCYACHHELRARGTRPQNTPGETHGALRLLTWYVPDKGLWDVLRDEDTKAIVALESDRAALLARFLADHLRGWALEQQLLRQWGRDDIEEILKKLAATPPEHATWDQCTQWYLAIVATERARLDHYDAPPLGAAAERDQHVQLQLQAIKELLNFSAGDANHVLNSPRDFDPQAFTDAAQRLSKLLQERKASGGNP
ncbi:MAG: multiheme c-type cytochrome [Planctomycetia bacterium]|nr:multiheme c-type cytochrome [Planctomycetia bacterium]